MSVESPQTREQIVRAFEEQEIESVEYWRAFDNDAFYRKIGSSWSPAETVRHLNKSMRPVVKALAMPKLFLRLVFGKPGRPSLTYDEFCGRYLQALAEGGQAGRFAPTSQSRSDLATWRHTIMSEFARVSGELRRVIGRWPERKLDSLQLPHPLLGKLTVREMLFFTLYHQRHHIAVVKRRLQESPAAGRDAG
jgi:DinB superfamily